MLYLYWCPMNRLQTTTHGLRSEKRKALVAYITGGYPDAGATPELVGALFDNGADIVEIGVPFSDPVADGATIQYASEQALKAGTSYRAILKMVEKIRKRNDGPVVLMSYLNPVYRRGLSPGIRDAANAGADGFIFPDLIPEEAGEIRERTERDGLSLVLLAAPTTPPARMKAIDAASSGFVYVVSLTGVTGGRKEIPPGIRAFLDVTARNITRNPRYVGFGISSPAHARLLKPHADGIIVGSAIIEIVRKSSSTASACKAVAPFIRSLKEALE